MGYVMALRRYEAREKDGVLTLEGEAKAGDVAETVHRRLLEMALAGTIAPGTEFRVRITEGDRQVGVWSFKAQPNRGEPGGPEMWDKLEKIAGKTLRQKRKKTEKKAVATVLTAARPTVKKKSTAKKTKTAKKKPSAKKKTTTKMAPVKRTSARLVKAVAKVNPLTAKKRASKAVARPVKRISTRKRA